MWQLLQAVSYLHKHNIGHRDISLENVLLSQGTVRLMDFGQTVRTHSSSGQVLRYFIPAGKPYYRAPESYIPSAKSIQVVVPPCAPTGEATIAQSPTLDILCHVRLPEGALPGQVCDAEPWGYPVKPLDVFACAVCIVITKMGSPPWRQARPTDAHFKWAQANGIAALAAAWKKTLPPGMDSLLSVMLKTDAEARVAIDDCLVHEWFAPLHATPVATHRAWASGLAVMGDGLPGDVYNDQDQVCRGSAIFLAAADHQDFSAGPFGDPYRAEEDVTRSAFDCDTEPVDAEILAGAPLLLPLIREAHTEDIM